MSLVEELLKLQKLHDDGLLNDAELAQAKAKLLAETPVTPPTSAINEQALQKQLADIKRQQRVLELDQRWEQERESYYVRGDHGRYIPTKGHAVFTVVIGVILSCLLFSVGSEGGGEVIVIGILLMTFIFGTAAYQYTKAEEYEEAEQSYEQYRSHLSRDE